MKEIRVLSETERNWAMFCHLAAFGGYLIPLFGNIIGPLICWLARKDESTWVNENGKASLNFQISMTLYLFLRIPLCFILIGFMLMGVLLILDIIFIIIASIRASRGEEFRYPLAIPFIQ
jgi:uncharacterized protein